MKSIPGFICDDIFISYYTSTAVGFEKDTDRISIYEEKNGLKRAAIYTPSDLLEVELLEDETLEKSLEQVVWLGEQ